MKKKRATKSAPQTPPPPPPEPDAMVYEDFDHFRGTTEEEPIIYIEYHKTRHGWKPDQVLTTTATFDFDWCEASQDLCYHESGGGGHSDGVGLGNFCAVLDAKKANKPIPLLAKIWYDRSRVKLHHNQKPVTGQEARALGYMVLDEPLEEDGHRNPFEWPDSLMDDTEYCTVCESRVRRESPCCHLKWEDGEGLTLGCGASEVDLRETQTSLYRLLRILPKKVVEEMRQIFSGGRGIRISTMDSMLGGNFSLSLYGQRKHVRIDGEYVGDEHNYEDRYWPGFAWLMSLDKHSREANQLTAAWIWQWQHETFNAGHVLPENHLYLELSDKELAPWLALDPMRPEELHERPLDISVRPKRGNCRNDLLFRQNPKGTSEVHLCCKRLRKPREHHDVTLSVAEVKWIRRDKVRVWFGRILCKDGTHISEMPGYRIAS